MTLSAHRISIEDRRENIDSMIYQMENLEQEKVKANSNICQAQNNLLLLIEGHKIQSRKVILDALGSLDKWSESAIEILYTLSDLYFKGSQLEKGYMIVEELERLEEDYSKASELAWNYLNMLRSNNTPGLSRRTQVTGTSLTTEMVKQCSYIQSCTQTGLCANIEQNKQQYRDVSVKSELIESSHIHNPALFYSNRQSDTTLQISSTLNRTESKLHGNIEADVIPTTLTCKAVDITSSGTEGKRRKCQSSSAFNESTSLMSQQNDVRRSAEYAEAVHLEVPRVVREDNYNICQYNWKRSKSSKTSKFSKRSKARKRYLSRRRSMSMKRHTSRNRSKYEKRYKSKNRPKFRKKSKSRKLLKSMKRSKFSGSSKSKKRLRSRMKSKSRKRFRNNKRAKTKMRYKSKIWPNSRKGSESRKMSWKMSRSWKRCKSRKRSKSKNQSTSRNRSKSKKGSVQREEDKESGPWIKCISRSSRVQVWTEYIHEIEKTSPVRNSRWLPMKDCY